MLQSRISKVVLLGAGPEVLRPRTPPPPIMSKLLGSQGQLFRLPAQGEPCGTGVHHLRSIACCVGQCSTSGSNQGYLPGCQSSQPLQFKVSPDFCAEGLPNKIPRNRRLRRILQGSPSFIIIQSSRAIHNRDPVQSSPPDPVEQKSDPVGMDFPNPSLPAKSHWWTE